MLKVHNILRTIIEHKTIIPITKFLIVIGMIVCVLLNCNGGVEHINNTVNYDVLNQEFIYILDAGHGGNMGDCGNKSIIDNDGSCFWEYKFNWELRDVLAAKLDSLGLAYVYTNTDSTFDMSLGERISKINALVKRYNKKFLVISIHADAASSKPEVERFDAYISIKRNKHSQYKDKYEVSHMIANTLLTELRTEFSDTSRGAVCSVYKRVREDNEKTMTFSPDCYAVLIENNFFTNPIIRERMKTKLFKERIACAYIKTIKHLEQYKNKSWKELENETN